MNSIKKFNNISDGIYTYLPAENYTITDNDDYDLALVRSADLTETVFPDSLFAIARAGAGTNNIPIPRCTEKGICVFNTPGANANAVKELVLCGMLLSGRDVIGGVDWLREQRDTGATGVDKTMEKAKNRFVGREIKGKKLGVIGLGAIGILVANMAVDLGMEVAGFDPFLSVTSALQLSRDVKIARGMEDLFNTCDFITLHLPQNDKTRGMINEALLARMKKDAVLLNFARGGLVNEADLISALENKVLGAYVTDFPTDKLLTVNGVIAFPHLGASTPEAEENCALMAAKQLDEYVRFGNIHNSVNLPAADMPFEGGWRLTVIHKNVTNMVGQITAVLAGGGINIEHMLNTSRGEWAYTMIDVSTPISAEALGQIKAIADVVRVRVIG